MSNPLDYIQKYPERTIRILGISDRQWQQLNEKAIASYQEQKKYFSGKQQSHTFKNSVISCTKGQDIIDVVVGARGPEADINLFNQQQAKFSVEQQFVGDKAYVGASRTTTPTKKPKGRELTTEQKENNQQISRQRIFVEHLIRRLKIFRIAGDKFRLAPQISIDFH